MSVELARNIAEQLESLEFHGIVNISGTGEPLLTKHIVDIVKEFGDRNLHIEIVTNGDVLDKDRLKKLYEIQIHTMVVPINHWVVCWSDS